MGCGECEKQKEGILFLLFADEGLGLGIKGLDDFMILKILFCGAHTIERAPAFLRGDLALPHVVARESVGIHVQ